MKHNCNKCQKPQYKLFLIMIEIHVNWENGRQLRFTRYQAGMFSNEVMWTNVSASTDIHMPSMFV